jgi:hypothetical protein
MSFSGSRVVAQLNRISHPFCRRMFITVFTTAATKAILNRTLQGVSSEYPRVTYLLP